MVSKIQGEEMTLNIIQRVGEWQLLEIQRQLQNCEPVARHHWNTLEWIGDQLRITREMIHHILCRDLDKCMISVKCMPHSLMDKQKEHSVYTMKWSTFKESQ
jgi:hypothetical protein